MSSTEDEVQLAMRENENQSHSRLATAQGMHSERGARGKLQPCRERRYQTITEGSVTMEYEMRGHDTKTKGVNDDDGPVFYNKASFVAIATVCA